MILLELKNISAAYDKNIILKDLNLNVEKGELISLLGPSGCGKTTTLRLIAGFMEAKDGKFLFDGRDYTKTPVHKRNFGFVFQSYALFPHLNVYDNVAFGLKMRKVSGKDAQKRIHEILEVVDLKGFEKRYPSELSGGQRQRVALARALVINPDLLLLDEPLSNLDAKLRVKMRLEIRRIQQELGITTVYVTHDQEECFSISDKVAVMNKGVIEQLDSPPAIYKYPATEFVARFVGFENFLDLNFENNVDGCTVCRAKNNTVFQSVNQRFLNKNENIKGAIRPDDIMILKEGSGEAAENAVYGTIGISTFLGRQYQYVVSTELGDFLVNDDTSERISMGEKVKLLFPKEKLILVQ